MRRSPGLGVLVPGFRQRGHPDPRRQRRLELELGAVLLAAAKRRGLVASTETGLFAADHDYRVPDIVVAHAANCSERGVDDTAALVVELRSPGDESYEKLPWYVARGVAEILVVDPPTRRFELYRTDAGTAMVVTPGDDDGVTLDTLGLHLITVVTSDGPRLRVITDTDSTDC